MQNKTEDVLKTATDENLLWSIYNAESFAATSSPTTNSNPPVEFILGGTCSNAFTPSLTHQSGSPSDSFVVIARSPMEEIEKWSLANLRDVQEKASSADFNSLISSMNPEDMQQKLGEVLQENSKLKETLVKNNDAMKRNFTSLVTWQEKVDSILNHHKLKFSEIKDLVYQLKKENNELKIKIANNVYGSMICKDAGLQCIEGTEEEQRKTEKSEMITSSTQYPEEVLITASMAEEFQNSLVPDQSTSESTSEFVKVSPEQSVHQNEIQNNLDVTSSFSVNNLNKSTDTNLFSDISEAEELLRFCNCSKTEAISSSNDDQAKNNTEEDSQSDSKSSQMSLPESSTEEKIIEFDNMQREIEKQMINSRDNFKKFDMNSLVESVSEHRKRLLTPANQYMDLLHSVVEFYTVERTRFRVIQESLIRFEKILPQINMTSEKTSENASKLLDSQRQIETLRSQLLQYIVQYGDHNKKLIEAQTLYQQIFWQYNTLVNDLETLEEENFKLKALDDNVKEKNKVLDNVTKQFVEKMRILSLREKEFEEKETNVQISQAMLSELVKENEKKVKKLNEEMDKLREEKLSLDRQSELYESKRMTESMENLSLQMKMKEKHDLEVKNLKSVIEELQMQLKLKNEECESTVVAVGMQMDIFKNDFDAERQSKESLLRERDNLKEAIAQMKREHETQSSARHDEFCRICHRMKGPGEQHGWNICNMEFD